MEENHKEIDSKTKSEVGALFQDCIVEPLTWQLQENQKSTAEAEEKQFKNIQEVLDGVKKTALGIKHDTKDAAQEKTLNTVEDNILGALSLKQKNITESVSAARNTITNQMATSFTSTGQKLDEVSRQLDGSEAKLLQQLAGQSKQTRDAMASGFSGAEQKLDAVSQQLDGSEAKLSQQLVEQSKQTRGAMASGFADAGQKLDAVSQQLEGSEAKVLQQLTEQNKQTRNVVTGGFVGAEQKIGTVSRQLEGCEAKLLEQLVEQSEQTRNAMTSSFVGAEQKVDALSQQVDADEEKVLQQLAEIVQQLTENAANTSTQLTQYQQDLQTEMQTGKSDLTETAMQKYKVLLGVSLSFGIVNFLGVVALLILNLMP